MNIVPLSAVELAQAVRGVQVLYPMVWVPPKDFMTGYYPPMSLQAEMAIVSFESRGFVVNPPGGAIQPACTWATKCMCP